MNRHEADYRRACSPKLSPQHLPPAVLSFPAFGFLSGRLSRVSSNFDGKVAHPLRALAHFAEHLHGSEGISEEPVAGGERLGESWTAHLPFVCSLSGEYGRQVNSLPCLAFC